MCDLIFTTAYLYKRFFITNQLASIFRSACRPMRTKLVNQSNLIHLKKEKRVVRNWYTVANLCRVSEKRVRKSLSLQYAVTLFPFFCCNTLCFQREFVAISYTRNPDSCNFFSQGSSASASPCRLTASII